MTVGTLMSVLEMCSMNLYLGLRAIILPYLLDLAGEGTFSFMDWCVIAIVTGHYDIDIHILKSGNPPKKDIEWPL